MKVPRIQTPSGETASILGVDIDARTITIRMPHGSIIRLDVQGAYDLGPIARQVRQNNRHEQTQR